MRSYNDIIPIEIIYKSKDNGEELSKIPYGTAVSGSLVLLLIYLHSTKCQDDAITTSNFIGIIWKFIQNKQQTTAYFHNYLNPYQSWS